MLTIILMSALKLTCPDITLYLRNGQSDVNDFVIENVIRSDRRCAELYGADQCVIAMEFTEDRHINVICGSAKASEG